MQRNIDIYSNIYSRSKEFHIRRVYSQSVSPAITSKIDITLFILPSNDLSRPVSTSISRYNSRALVHSTKKRKFVSSVNGQGLVKRYRYGVQLNSSIGNKYDKYKKRYHVKRMSSVTKKSHARLFSIFLFFFFSFLFLTRNFKITYAQVGFL